MTEDEKEAYKLNFINLLNRKRKALSLPIQEREKYADEYNKICQEIKEKSGDYLFYQIGIGCDSIAESEEDAYIMLLSSLDDVWSLIDKLIADGESERLIVVLDALREIYNIAGKCGKGWLRRNDGKIQN